MKKSRHRRSGAVFKVLAVLITAVSILLAMSVFFKISRIDVAGAESYSPEEIIEASGIEVGENLFFVDRFGAASHIFAELPYIDTVTVSRKVYPELYNHKLNTVCEYLSIDLSHHNGKSDAMGCLMILLKAMSAYDIYEPEEFIKRIRLPLKHNM